MLNGILAAIRSLYLTDRFFWVSGGLVVLFVAGFWWAPLFYVAQAGLIAFIGLLLWEGRLFYGRPPRLRVRRRLPRVLSLGDTTAVTIEVQNRTGQPFHITVIDELPFQLQKRDFASRLYLKANEQQSIRYPIRPLERGMFSFGAINLYVSTSLGLLERRVRREADVVLSVYPSIVQMKQFEFRAFDRATPLHGIRRMRRIGHSYEFDQIKNYITGDDYRSINWKATGRRAGLMVNQYEDERAQQVYCIIDKSRAMRLPFAGLSLMDYAINASLVLSNIALKKHDRAGLISFADKIGTVLKADSQAAQLQRILQQLYKEKEHPLEADFEVLYYATRKLISGRSLLLLFTNFESPYALERVLPILRRINAFHLLVVVFFENTEIRDLLHEPARTVEEVYRQTVARQFLSDKSAMVQKLRLHGIQAVLTRPEELTVNTINKYLELKSRGLI